jgi:hypothetical protein
MAKWRRPTVEFKRQAVERMKTCENTHELARELKIQRKLLYTWRYQFEGRPEALCVNPASFGHPVPGFLGACLRALCVSALNTHSCLVPASPA